MNRTIEGSKGCDIICMSFGKEKERGKGIKVVKAGKKDTFIEAESKEFNVGDSKLFENNKLEQENGAVIINFADYKQAKNNNENRITEFAVAKARIEEKRKSKTDKEQVI